MDESQDSAAFAECVTVDPSRAEYVQQVLSAARETLARSCGEEFQFRGRPADVPGAPERSRDRPLAARDRISSSPLNPDLGGGPCSGFRSHPYLGAGTRADFRSYPRSAS